MRAKGISYDTGYIHNGVISRESLDPEVVERELRIIRDDLLCNAVRITGGDPERLEVAATHAADLGLEVWFSPYPLALTIDELLTLFADCAGRAERLRRRGSEVVFVTGAELSLMNTGFLPGDTLDERFRLLHQPHRLRELLPQASARVNDFLGKAVATVREHFGGTNSSTARMATPAPTSTWPATASSRCSMAGTAKPTRTCRGSRRPPSSRLPTATAIDPRAQQTLQTAYRRHHTQGIRAVLGTDIHEPRSM